MTQPSLDRKVVVITGGAGLIGREFARAVAVHGGIPVIADIRAAQAREAAERIEAQVPGARVASLEMDITSVESLRAAIGSLESSLGGIDALVNNAYPRNKNYGRRFEDVTFTDFCENVNLHLGGYFLASQQFAQYFKARGAGNIVTISSIYGVMAPRFSIYEGTPLTMPVEYAAIKSALIHLNRYMMRYFQGSGVRFNCLSPGGVEDAQPASFLERYAAFAGSKGMLHPRDLCGTLVFLLSEESRFINGQNIVVDDGWSV